MPKRSRRRFIGSWSERQSNPIPLPRTIANLRILLAQAAAGDCLYSHQQIKDWAWRFWWERFSRPGDLGIDIDAAIEQAADVALEIEAQWDMLLGDPHSLDELQHMDFATVELPRTWFVDWLGRLPSVSDQDEAEQ